VAKVVENHQFPHGGRKGLVYDWMSLLDGKQYMLTQGEDFPPDVTPKTFVGALARFANNLDPKLRVKRDIQGKDLYVQGVPQGGTNGDEPDADPEPEPEPEPAPATTPTRRRGSK